MAERKSQNKYYPPDWDPSKGSVNTFRGQHPLRDRARKLHLGIMVIRFEMPFNVWCEGCSNHIGKGVRYNAEKKKKFVIETDPKNCDYKLVSGVKKKNEEWEPEEANVIPLPDDQEKARLETDPIFRLEHTAEDEQKAAARAPSMVQLMKLQEGFKKDYDLNCALRKTFRGKRKEIQAAERADKEFLKKASLDIALLPADQSDTTAARSIAFDADKDKLAVRKHSAATGGIFASSRPKLSATPSTPAPKVSPASRAAGSRAAPAAQSLRAQTMQRRELLEKSHRLGFTSLARSAPTTPVHPSSPAVRAVVTQSPAASVLPMSVAVASHPPAHGRLVENYDSD